MTQTPLDALFQQTLWLAGIAFVLMFVTHVLLRIWRVNPLAHLVLHVGAAALVMAKIGLGASWLLLLVAPAAVFFWLLTRGLAILSGLGFGRGRDRERIHGPA